MKIKFSDIKKSAKITLKAQAADMILIRFLVDFVVNMVSLLSITVGGYIVSGPMEYGILSAYYRAFQGEDIEPEDLLLGFRTRFGESFLAGLVVRLIKSIPVLLSVINIIAILSTVASASSLLDYIDFGFGVETLRASLTTIIVLAVCYLLCVIFVYAFSMVQFVLYMNQEMTAMDALKTSGMMMRGEKFRLFLFDLSFIPWFVLTILTSGIAGFWARPYYTEAKIIFMAEVYARKKEEVIV